MIPRMLTSNHSSQGMQMSFKGEGQEWIRGCLKDKTIFIGDSYHPDLRICRTNDDS